MKPTVQPPYAGALESPRKQQDSTSGRFRDLPLVGGFMNKGKSPRQKPDHGPPTPGALTPTKGK